MKTLFSLVFVIFSAASLFAQENPWDIKLPFESATIDYKVSGSMNGKKILYVKDYGRTAAEYSDTSMNMFGMTQQQKEITITTPEWIYTIDAMNNTGSKQVNPQKYFIEEFNRLSKSQQKKVIKNSEKFGVTTVEGMHGTVQKDAVDFLGYKCDKTSMMGMVVYSISGTGLPLKIEGNVMGVQVSEVATGIKEGSVPASKFKVPSNINLTHNKEADRMMQAQARSMMQSLIDGKSPGMTAGGANRQQLQQQNQMTPEQQEQMKQMMQMFGNQNQ